MSSPKICTFITYYSPPLLSHFPLHLQHPSACGFFIWNKQHNTFFKLYLWDRLLKFQSPYSWDSKPFSLTCASEARFERWWVDLTPSPFSALSSLRWAGKQRKHHCPLTEREAQRRRAAVWRSHHLTKYYWTTLYLAGWAVLGGGRDSLFWMEISWDWRQRLAWYWSCLQSPLGLVPFNTAALNHRWLLST